MSNIIQMEAVKISGRHEPPQFVLETCSALNFFSKHAVSSIEVILDVSPELLRSLRGNQELDAQERQVNMIICFILRNIKNILISLILCMC
jgi:hypothetical protein